MLLKAKRFIAKGKSQKAILLLCYLLFPFLYPASFLVFHFFMSGHTLACTTSATHRQVPVPLQQTAEPGRRVARLGLPKQYIAPQARS